MRLGYAGRFNAYEIQNLTPLNDSIAAYIILIASVDFVEGVVNDCWH